MGFSQTLRKFFDPVFVLPKEYALNTIDGIYQFIYAVFSLEIYKLILKSIEYKETGSFRNLIIIFFIGSTFMSLIRFTSYKWGWGHVMSEGSIYYYKKYLHQYIQAEGNEIEKIGTGRFVSIVGKGLRDWFAMVHNLTQEGLSNILFVFYTLYSIFCISILGGFVSIILISLGCYIATKANIFMKKKRLMRTKEENEAQHQVVIALMSKNELMQNNGLNTILNKINKNYKLANIYHWPVNLGFQVIDEFPKFMFLLIRIGIYTYLAHNIFLENGSFSELAIFITIITLAESSVNNFLQLLRKIFRDYSSVEILWNTFETLTPIKGYDKGEIFSIKGDKIILKDVTYSYTENKKIFNKFSLEIEGNKKTALVGVSGGGKTTLMKIIAGYLRQQKGTVEVFGNDLKKTSLKSYFANLGYLTQEPSVFDGTIRENLQASVKDETTEEIMIQALKDAECDFVFEFENGIDTEIGEKGIRLSGGQRQRLAIAKVFIKDPKIILLDEPTSALDSFSEERITKAMHRLFKGRTVIIIAHRLQTVKEAEDIILIDDGKVIERGTHRELVVSKGVYKNMLDLQSGF